MKNAVIAHRLCSVSPAYWLFCKETNGNSAGLHCASARSYTVYSNNAKIKRKPCVLAAGHNLPGLLQPLRGQAMCCQTEDTTTPFNTLYLA